MRPLIEVPAGCVAASAPAVPTAGSCLFPIAAFVPLQGISRRGDARVYGGIHFRSACIDALKKGEQIGHYLRPLKK